MNFLEYIKEASKYKTAQKKAYGKTLSWKLITNFTDEALERILVGISLKSKIYPLPKRSPYQGHHQTLRESSDHTDISFLCFDVHHFKHSPFHDDTEELNNLLGEIETYCKRNRGFVIVSTITTPFSSPYGTLLSEDPLVKSVKLFNDGLLTLASTSKNIYVCNIDKIFHQIGEKNARELRNLYAFDIPFSNEFLLALAQEWMGIAKARMGLSKKCIMLDLDNTLWGGIIGEDGIEGIALGTEYPGNVYASFQQTLLKWHKRGIILTINSRNTLSDIEEVFKKHPSMALTLEHFAAIRANWEPKTDNLKSIAEELNIGTDSIIFIDDDPLNRETIRIAYPEVLIPEFTSPPEELQRELLFSPALTQLSLTGEDKERSSFYVVERKRRTARESATSLESYLRNLKIVVEITENDKTSVSRLAQLCQKTNQFNLTTKRHDEQDIERLMANGWIFSGRIKDRFGDYGLTLLAIVEYQDKKAFLDTLLMSCRVMGREVEKAFIAHILKCLKNKGVKTLEAHYSPTLKNTPVKEFLETVGIKPEKVAKGGEKKYVIDLSRQLPGVPTFITINEYATS